MSLADSFIFWAMTGFITVLILVSGYFVKKWINGLSKWKIDLDKEGGVVSRNQYFAWCKESMDKCSSRAAVSELYDWKEGLLEKGGIMTILDSIKMVEKISLETSARIDKALDAHHELINEKLKLLQSNVQNNILIEIRKLREDVKKNGNGGTGISGI